MSKNESLDTLRALFAKKRVLDMAQLMTALNVTARYTVFRYLRELHHLTSYTHNGKYYTLREIAQFDPNGFWHFGDIGFSVHGTLIDTLHQIINESAAGKSNSELEKHCRARVQVALRTLLQSKRVARIKPGSRNLYVSADPAVSDLQVRKRTEKGSCRRLPTWIVCEILVETIRLCPKVPSIGEVTLYFSKRGSSITKSQIQQVFEEYQLEKKTLD
jgi:hypothetical protein